MAVMGYKQMHNGYTVTVKLKCSYKNGFINEFDSHDMHNDIDEMMKYINVTGFQEIAKHIFNHIKNVYSVSFEDEKSYSEYFLEDVNEDYEENK